MYDDKNLLSSVSKSSHLEYPTLPRTSFIFLAQISLRSLSGLIGLLPS